MKNSRPLDLSPLGQGGANLFSRRVTAGGRRRHAERLRSNCGRAPEMRRTVTLLFTRLASRTQVPSRISHVIILSSRMRPGGSAHLSPRRLPHAAQSLLLSMGTPARSALAQCSQPPPAHTPASSPPPRRLRRRPRRVVPPAPLELHAYMGTLNTALSAMSRRPTRAHAV